MLNDGNGLHLRILFPISFSTPNFNRHRNIPGRLVMIKGSFLSLAFFLFFSTLGIAQDITGNIEGRIVDSVGTPLFGANISLKSESLQGLRGTSTGDEGYFRIFALPIGSYKVKISFVGYREITFENVQISLGKTTNLGQIRLEQRTYNLREVVVSGERFTVDPTSSTYGGNLNSKDFENLPVDRNYRGMISLLPQANTSYYGDEVNIGGATGFENKYFVDGVEVTDPLLGNTGTNLPYNFVKEIEVKAGGYESEFRSSLGGLINVVTYSGTNEFHGSVFGFYTNNRFGSKRLIGLMDPTQGDFSDYDIGFSLGGPIIHDKLWFFAAYNPTFNRREVEVPSFGISIDKTLRHSFASKLTWSPSHQLRLILTVTGDPTERTAIGYNAPVVSALLNPDPYLQELRQGGINVSLNGTYSIGQNILLRGSYSRVMRYDSGEPSTKRGGDEVLFQDYQTNTYSGGTWQKWDTYRYSNVAKLGGTIMLGSNILNAGIEYKLDGVNNQDYNDVVIKWDSTNWEERIGIGGKIFQRSPSVFLQDTWQIFQSLSIRGGIRWEDQLVVGSNGQRMQRIGTPLQPRFGFTFLPDEDGSQKIFGSYGRYAQELSLLTPTYWYAEGGSWYVISYDHDPRISRAGGVILPGSGLHSANLEVEGLRDQFFDEFSLGYQQAIGENFLASIQGVYRTLREAIAGVYNQGKGEGGRPRPKRNYSALVITVENQRNQHFNFLASYVLSREYGNYSGVFDAFYHTTEPNMNFLPNDLEQVQRATGLLPNDRTHVFKFSGSYNFSFGLTTGISFVAQTGTPLSEYASGSNYDVLITTRGNAGRTPAIWDLNARLTYEVPYLYNWNTRLILDIFHIASQRQPVDVDQYRYFITSDGNLIPSPTYRQAYRYQPAMSVRLGMEVSF